MCDRDRMLVFCFGGCEYFLTMKIIVWFWSCQFLLSWASVLVLVTWFFSLVGFHRKQFFFRFICSENHSTSRWQKKCYRGFTAFGPNFAKTALFFLQVFTKFILWVESTALPTTMLRYAFYPIADIRSFMLGNVEELRTTVDLLCFTVLHIGTWTASIHSSSIDSVQKVFSNFFWQFFVKWIKYGLTKSLLVNRQQLFFSVFSTKCFYLCCSAKKTRFWVSTIVTLLTHQIQTFLSG